MAEESQESTTGVPNEIANAFAAQVVSASNPLNQSTEPKTFVSEPFFKAEGAATEEVVAEVVEAPTGGETVAEPIVEVEKQPVVETPVATEPEIERIPEQDFIGLINEAIAETETSFASIQEIKAVIEENKKYKANQEQYAGLTQEERARIEIGREFGDFSLYDRISGIDTLKLSPKEALRQVFLIENVGKSPQLLEKQFEKQYTKTYEEDPDEDYSKMLLENNGQEAIQTITELQADLKQRGQISGGANSEDAKKAKLEQDNEWVAAVDRVIAKNDRITHDFGDGVKINIVTDVRDKQIIQDAMDSPIDFLKSLITDKDGNYNHEALYRFIVRNVYYEKGLDEARKAGAAVREERILKEKKNSDTIITPPAGGVGAESNLSEQLAGNFRQLISNTY